MMRDEFLICEFCVCYVCCCSLALHCVSLFFMVLCYIHKYIEYNVFLKVSYTGFIMKATIYAAFFYWLFLVGGVNIKERNIKHD